MSSCYDDYLFDYDRNAIYFANQIDVRTFVVGEGMKFSVGATFAGEQKNQVDRNVKFILNSSLVTPAILSQMKGSTYSHIKSATSSLSTLVPLPDNYFKLSDKETIVIKKGWHIGKIDVIPDSALFLSDATTLEPTYVLPFYITNADADTILESKRYSVIGVKYENKLFGNYWHGGAAIVKRPGKSDTTYLYKTTIPVPENKIFKLTTTKPLELALNGYLDQSTGKKEMLLTLTGNNITISNIVGSTHIIVPDGQSTFNDAKLLQNRKIFLKYKYTNQGNGYTYHCTDTLTFRNRIRDGVNEWQDENPTHYAK